MSRSLFYLFLAVAVPACSFDRTPTANGEFGARGGDAGRDGGLHDAGLRDAGGDAAPDGAPAVDAAPPPVNPCGGDCPSDRPRCIATLELCVECARDAHCSDPSAPACDPGTHTCVACTADEHCPGEAPRCDPSAHACVTCLEDGDCGDEAAPRCDRERDACVGCVSDEHCGPDAPLCDLEEQRCVECLEHADCGDAARPQCEDQRCVPCSSAGACEGREDATICDTAQDSPLAGQCVQCTASDEAPCDGRVCDPGARACTDRPLASKSTCEPCIADSECVADHRCVAMAFKGQALPGGYCLKQLASECARPYAASPITRASLSSDAEGEYCGVAEELTSCAAIARLIADAECTGDPDCSSPGALCRTVNGVANRCTYACGASSQCPAGFQCNGGYCGGSNSNTGGSGG